MYILYNHDGSIKRTNFTEFIQKGNNNVNKIFVSIDGVSTSDYLVLGSFLLPNDEPVQIVGTVDSQEIDGITYNGYTISLSDDVTQYEGRVKASILVRGGEEPNYTFLYTYPVILTVNDAVTPEITQINITQYLDILTRIAKKLDIASNGYIKVINTDRPYLYEFDPEFFNAGDIVLNRFQGRFLRVYKDDNDKLKGTTFDFDLIKFLGPDDSATVIYQDELHCLTFEDDDSSASVQIDFGENGNDPSIYIGSPTGKYVSVTHVYHHVVELEIYEDSPLHHDYGGRISINLYTKTRNSIQDVEELIQAYRDTPTFYNSRLFIGRGEIGDNLIVEFYDWVPANVDGYHSDPQLLEINVEISNVINDTVTEI